MVSVTECKIKIPTYREPAAEEMPMFAENRVHQRTSGNPYPNHIVLEVDREHKEDKEYTCVRLENEYLRIEILPELGGRIYSAYDKTTGYDFFYKQHVIKPALIGCLGSWVSGGLEFNWPFHHRASTFMPTDYCIERQGDGSVIVWLSEHDPIERMKGMVGIVLKPGEAKFETRMKLCNRTSVTSSFLWWENTAVPVNKEYQIFYPKDVSYVNFHYKRSVTTYPVATNALGVFNGIRYNGETDISMHKNTVQPTSYFCAPSKYDFFGGFDHGKGCGVVHVANHHTAPGKKMFTWAYNQLSTSWENALTDTDGAYAELMAGSYSDNQPDFAWIEPYETKEFSQHWYPIGKLGIPCYANLNGAVHWDSDGLIIQTTSDKKATVTAKYNNDILLTKDVEFKAGVPCSFNAEFKGVGSSVSVVCDGKEIIYYLEEEKNIYDIPDTFEDMPNFKEVKTAQELYLEGVHVWQYRDPAILPDGYWKEALNRDGEHIDSLNALAVFNYKRNDFETALEYAKRAEKVVCKYNKHPQSGEIFFNLGLIYLAKDELDTAYDYFYKSSWNMDYYSAAMTHVAAIDGKRGQLENMLCHSKNALRYNAENPVASVYEAIAKIKLGDRAGAVDTVESVLNSDPLNHLARYVYCKLGIISNEDYYSALKSDASQTCMDIAFDLYACGMNDWAADVLCGVEDKSPMIYYILGDYEKAENTSLYSSFPFRTEEYKILKSIVEENTDLPMAHYYYGCMLYASGHYECAAEHFEKAIDLKPDFYIPYRNLAAAYYSHLNRKGDVLPLLKKALELNPKNRQLVYEYAYVSAKLGVNPKERIEFILDNSEGTLRDDVGIELARAYNQNGEYEKTIELFNSHTFVPCEGGEHAVAEQYMFAHHAIGRRLLSENKFTEAAEEFKKAQILPQNLGAGLWNECKLVPHRFYLAKCYEKISEYDKANEIYDHILELKIDYFSNMHLPELPFYQAMAYTAKGDFLMGRALIDEYLKKWNDAITKEDVGYFGTTPFFISYCDDAKTVRKAYYSYLLGFAYRFMERYEKSKEMFGVAADCDKSNLWYSIER
ncbi:MAG: DUF5107 domain-containing protein [Clostridia bacterium]|nr:DUF5107 domain-containing protein [Clostridia bacterium]